MDKDNFVGHQIKDLLYYWNEKDDWKKCERVYLLSSKKKNFIETKHENCNDIKSFFKITNVVRNMEIRRNGYKLGIFEGKTIDEVYSETDTWYQDDIFDKWKENIIPNTLDCISRSKMELQPHQSKVVEYLQDHRGVVAAHEVGTGKTLLAVAASQCFLDSHPKSEVIVVTPKSLQLNFMDTLQNKYGAGSVDPRYSFYTIGKFSKVFHIPPGGKPQKVFPKGAFLIIDEAHNLRTDIQKSKSNIVSAKVAIDAAKKAGKVLLLTATPFYNKFYDISNLVSMVKGVDYMTESAFNSLIANNPENISKYVQGVFSVHRNTDLDLFPSSTEHEIRIEMSLEYYKNYKALEDMNIDFFNLTNPWPFLTGMREATNGLKPYQKTEPVMEIVRRREKTVIYSTFRTFGIDVIKGVLDNEDIEHVEVNGSMSVKEREKAVSEFNSDEGANVLFITKAGGEGLDLKGTRNIIHLETGWNREGEKQINGRGIRRGSHMHLPENERHVDIYYIILKKPKQEFRKYDHVASVDVMMKEMFVNTKEKKAEEILKIIEDNSIENKAGFTDIGGSSPYEKYLQFVSQDVFTIFVTFFVPSNDIKFNVISKNMKLVKITTFKKMKIEKLTKKINDELSTNLEIVNKFTGENGDYYIVKKNADEETIPKGYLYDITDVQKESTTNKRDYTIHIITPGDDYSVVSRLRVMINHWDQRIYNHNFSLHNFEIFEKNGRIVISLTGRTSYFKGPEFIKTVKDIMSGLDIEWDIKAVSIKNIEKGIARARNNLNNVFSIKL